MSLHPAPNNGRVVFAALAIGTLLATTPQTSSAEDLRAHALRLEQQQLRAFRDSRTRHPRSTQGTCPGAYAALTHQPVVRIGIFFGLMDTPVGLYFDPVARQALTEHLEEPCVPGYNACGFTAPANRNGVLERVVGSRRIELTLHHPFITGTPEAQRLRSQEVAQEYLRALHNDDVVLYLGHSRFGTGPGFVDLPTFSSLWRQTYLGTPWIHQITEELASAAKKPALIGILGCHTERYYGAALRAASPSSELVLSTGSTRVYVLVTETANVINTVVGGDCYQPSHDPGRIYGVLPQYRSYPPAEGSPWNFGTRLSFRQLLALFLSLPMLVIAFSTGAKANEDELFQCNRPRKQLAYSFGAVLVPCAAASLGLFKPRILESHSAPILTIATGLLLCVAHQDNEQLVKGVTQAISKALRPMAAALILLFAQSVVAHGGLRGALSAFANTCEFALFFLALLPFAFTTVKVLWQPVREDLRAPRVFRAITSLVATGALYGLLLLAMLNAQPSLFGYADVLLAPLLFMLPASVLVYLRTRSWTEVVVFQSMLLAVLFSQRLHSLAD